MCKHHTLNNVTKNEITIKFIKQTTTININFINKKHDYIEFCQLH